MPFKPYDVSTFSLLRFSPTIKGILFALVSTALFTAVGVMVRVLSDSSMSAFQILLFRQSVFLAVLLPSIWFNWSRLLRPKHLQLHVMRIAGAFTALVLGFIVVAAIPLANATALGFTQVLFVALLSRVVLGERVSWQRMATLIIGFVGVMLVVQPSFEGGTLFYSLLGLVAAFGAAIAALCVRKIAQQESKVALLAYQAFFVGLLALPLSIQGWVSPNIEQFVLLLGVGLVSSIAQWFGVTAYQYGKANVISNVEYIKIIYASIFGFYLFGELPNSLAIAGVVVLISSVVIPNLTIGRRSKVC
ncbi:DMT family transporter [Vibrio maritimus]|uniref:DMT family transporter n=1 Tax=Vibrio maritimus TaxID=990268 RepID=UPI0037360C59